MFHPYFLLNQLQLIGIKPEDLFLFNNQIQTFKQISLIRQKRLEFMFQIIFPEAIPLSIKEGTIDVQSKYFDSNPSKIEPHYLNNFFLFCPGGQTRDFSTEIGNLDKTLLELFNIKDLNQNTTIRDLTSKKRREMTQREFYKEIDSTISNQDEIIELNRRLTSSNDVFERDKLEYLLGEELITPYLRLRDKGFRHYDLVM